MPTPSEPPEAASGESAEDELPRPKALPLQLEIPGAKAQAQPQEDPRREPRPRAPGTVRRWLVPLAVVLAVLAGAAVVVVVWVLPWYVRSECIREAAAHGITLEIDDAAIDAQGFRLLGVKATAPAMPGAKAQAPEIEVTTRDLRPDTMTVRRAELTLTGRWSTVDGALEAWRASPAGGQEGAWTPSSVVFEDSRVVWQTPFAENALLEASNVHFDVTWSGGTQQVHARSDRVTLGVPGGKVGPWRVDVDRTPETSRVRVALDPAVPEACTVLVVQDAAGATSVDVVVPRSPLARLGLPPALLGLRGKALQAELTAHYVPMGPERADASARGGIYGIEAGLPVPLDVAWDVTATGAPRSGLDLKKARLAAGPLVGAVTGTLKPFDDGFRVDLAWSAGPVPCTAFDAPIGEGDPFDIAYQLRKLAAGVGMIKGDVSARGSLSFDSRDLGLTRLEFVPEAKCQVALFGP